jgi:AcrR family transcriptional regulator
MTPVTADRSPRPRRADAVRNRERVLQAAEDAFATDGRTAQLDDIAARAGVGVGTVCRHFPTKQALLEAVLVHHYESLLAQAKAGLNAPEPGPAFERFVRSIVDFHGRHRAFAEHMASELELATQPARDQLMRAVTALVERAQHSGSVRSDIGPGDVSMLFTGVAHATAVLGDFGPTLRERYVQIILDGLRPEAASPLPGRPLDFAQLRRMKRRVESRHERSSADR